MGGKGGRSKVFPEHSHYEALLEAVKGIWNVLTVDVHGSLGSLTVYTVQPRKLHLRRDFFSFVALVVLPLKFVSFGE